ncbi:TonB-dependent receptor [Dasania marina]|uniref:TonB-dependent receptor n=1 Tax=Dasania marina TaxID=471499 RepID=UPI0030DDDB56
MNTLTTSLSRAVRYSMFGIAALNVAPTMASSLLEEIIVTAQKRMQSTMEVPIAISAVSGDQLRQLGFTNAQQVAAMAPGVSTVQPNGEANYSMAIRGVSNSNFISNVESPVALYVDEVYISQSAGAGFALFDMQRVEILKGPQGTLFGRNATGGLANYITKKPEEEFEGYAQLTAGSYDQVKFEGAVGGSLSEKVTTRISLSTNDNDGYIKNRNAASGGKKLNNANDIAARWQVSIAAADNVEVLLNTRYGKSDIRTGVYQQASADGSGNLTPGVGDAYGYEDTDGDVYAGDWDSPGSNDVETSGYTATVTWEIDDYITLTSITDYSKVDREYFEDTDAGPNDPLNNGGYNYMLSTEAEQFSQELRINGSDETVDWVAGAYHLNIDAKDLSGIHCFCDYELESDLTLVDPSFDVTADFTLPGMLNPYRNKTQSTSIFGQVDYSLSDSMIVTAGLRAIHDKQDFDFAVVITDVINPDDFLNPNIVGQLGPAVEDSVTSTEWSSRLGLSWDVSQYTMLYASWSRGVKSGGWNSYTDPRGSAGSRPTGADLRYDPEELDAYEVGFKSSLLNGSLVLTGAAYYYDYANFQAFTFEGITGNTFNAEAKTSGFELELKSNPVEGLDILFGAGYIDNEVTLPSGTKTSAVQTPLWNLNTLVRYEWDLFTGMMALQFDSQYRDKHTFALDVTEAVSSDSYTISNMSISYIGGEENWDVRVFVNNLEDEEYLVQAFDLGGDFGLQEGYYGTPRWAGVSASYNW